MFYNLKFGRNRSNSEKAYWVALKNHKITWSTEAAKAELKFCVFFSENKSTVCKFATTASLATRIRTHRLSQIPQCASYCGAESNSKMCIIQRSQTSRCTSHQGYRTRSHQTDPYSHQRAPTVTQQHLQSPNSPLAIFLSKIILLKWVLHHLN